MDIQIFTESSEFVDGLSIDAWTLETLDSVLYGDLSYYEGPRIVQVPMTEDELIGKIQHLLDINADCWGTADRIELVLV